MDSQIESYSIKPISAPHVYLHDSLNFGVDYSLSTNISVTNTDTSTWIPKLNLGANPRGVYWRNSIFGCDRTAICKMFPMGHSEWMDVQGYQEVERNFFDIVVVAEKVFIAGGRPFTLPGEFIIYLIGLGFSCKFINNWMLFCPFGKRF